MDPFPGLSIHVISDGRALQLYNDPDDEPANHPWTRQRYVEAVTGATFRVRITLSKEFDLFSLQANDAVRVLISYDSQRPCWLNDFVVDDLRFKWSRGQPAECDFWYMIRFDETSQQWRQGATTFCALDTKDTADTKASVDQVKNLGRIQVTAGRVHRIKRATPLAPIKILEKPITEISEKMLKGKAIVSTVRTTNEVVSKEPIATPYDAFRMPGEDGQLLTTLIFYRPRRTLQMLGCIPRSPSPELESSTEPVLNASAQLALLEGDAKVEAEDANAKRRIKREIVDTEDLQITDARSTNKRARHSGPTGTVDLTDD